MGKPRGAALISDIVSSLFQSLRVSFSLGFFSIRVLVGYLALEIVYVSFFVGLDFYFRMYGRYVLLNAGH